MADSNASVTPARIADGARRRPTPAWRKRLSKAYGVFEWVMLIGFAVLFIYPILWLVINSFKDNTQLFRSTWSLPTSLSLDNYKRAFETGNIGRSFINSVIITGSVVIITTLLASMSAYALTRLKWKLSGVIFSVMLLAMMVPAHATVIPLFSMFNGLGINGTYFAVIIPLVVFTLPVAMLIFAGFYRSLPGELEEAAKIDGCSTLKTFRLVILPISTPAVVTVMVITFIVAWNDLLFPQVFLTDPDRMPLPVGLTNFQGRYSTDYVGLIAAVVVTIVPSLVIYSLLHRRVTSGMTAGALKG